MVKTKTYEKKGEGVTKIAFLESDGRVINPSMYDE